MFIVYRPVCRVVVVVAGVVVAPFLSVPSANAIAKCFCFGGWLSVKEIGRLAVLAGGGMCADWVPAVDWSAIDRGGAVRGHS